VDLGDSRSERVAQRSDHRLSRVDHLDSRADHRLPRFDKQNQRASKAGGQSDNAKS
jgi:hypothetical protein